MRICWRATTSSPVEPIERVRVNTCFAGSTTVVDEVTGTVIIGVVVVAGVVVDTPAIIGTGVYDQ